MNELEVRIERLEPSYVAYAYGFGNSPEEQAGNTLQAWVKEKGLAHDGKKHRFFGFDNPSPSPGSPNYGYEVWITIDDDAEAEGEVKIKEFAGGLYAVTRFKGLDNIGRVWKELVVWCENSDYKFAHQPCLEELLTPANAPFEEYVFDLYMSIAE
ncbi:MAG: GyrI-like domain-containing protein [Chloroflexi bacterium]|nr:GyrI-like domain-containing protein [Chloroflexota bacterium]